jgi:hypothetical protein
MQTLYTIEQIKALSDTQALMRAVNEPWFKKIVENAFNSWDESITITEHTANVIRQKLENDLKRG